ncbi:MAG: hypothetical protein NTW87_36015 [Planctomycetota bacterium]|nr:hypothetical protein [Planctomycetota bacterium]
MAPPSWLQTTADKLAVWLHGGVRVRVWHADGKAQGSARGGNSSAQAARLLRTVLDLEPEGSGTVDLVSDGSGHWRITVRGSIADPTFEQRLRNVVASG